MKNKIIMCTCVMVAMCFACCKTTKIQPQVTQQKQESRRVESVLEVADTLDIGTFKRSGTTGIIHLECKCSGQQDIRIIDIKITNPSLKITSSPIITAGSKGTILCLIETSQLSIGEHIDAITIKTNSEVKPEVSAVLKYTIK